jgi:REP element-mobilizing transposase RayT
MPDSPTYFITWTTYGTWLPGEAKGSFIDDRRDGPDRYGPNRHLRQHAAAQLTQPPVVLDERARAIIDRAIREHAAHRMWPVFALNVRSNHVHLVMTAGKHPDGVMTGMKAWATRALREAGLVGAESKVWTRHGSTKHLHTPDSIEQAVRYVIEGQ